ncbi:PREDICTED: poly(rC)-binding protein 3-like isoform X2 [Branchiostoma belcheri]|uniref:Poly(RC)-binding protein 3-like isoform X2 n=1 Tax=Branchiostoma belcheri TaxID=7741 RepID=A0A6P4ZKH4_BRABE|nr:PREDICTED: poly(rC)-binding protein 3-like isoform X2 [Branchiostoma belcheri]
MDISLTTENKVPGEAPSVTLTIRLIMQGKDVGSIIGKKGDTIKRFREESGARINISDGSSPERIVTITGSTENILKAFNMIGKKFEEDMKAAHVNSSVPVPPVTLRLIVPASQCGSLIGKGGSKIKEIREVTGASIQVAGDMLPNSTERAVTVSGTPDAISQCVYHICCVMLESPPKGATIPYKPRPASGTSTSGPVVFAGGQAYTIQGQYAIPNNDLTKLHQLALQQTPYITPGTTLPAALATQFGVQTASQPGNPSSQTTHELTIPNELIGCIIGKGGCKINEIRQLSGATIKIAGMQEGSTDRQVTITGTPESISTAQFFINTSLELAKRLTPDLTTPTTAPSSTLNPTSLGVGQGGTPTPLAVPLSSLMSLKPVPLLGLAQAGLLDATSRSSYTAKVKNATGTGTSGAKKSDRNKFAPY